MLAARTSPTVYILSSYGYYSFRVDSLSVELKVLKETVNESEELYKVEIFQGKLYVAAGFGGVKVYKVHDDFQLSYLNTLKQKDQFCSDFAIDREKRLLYAMDYSAGVYVYDISEETVDDNKQPINITNPLVN